MNTRRTLTIFFAAAFLACGQPPLSFEVASVKPSAPNSPFPGDDRRNMDSTPGQFAMKNVNLMFAWMWAYDLRDYQITGPGWINADRYDIHRPSARRHQRPDEVDAANSADRTISARPASRD